MPTHALHPSANKSKVDVGQHGDRSAFGGDIVAIVEDPENYKGDAVTPPELPDLAKEVRREYEMVRVCATVIFKRGERLNPLLRNVFVLALNIHTRNLVGFFEGSKNSRISDDVFATHFAPDWDRKRHGSVDLIWLKSALIPGIHKRVAHITAYRTRVDPSWDAQSLVEIGSAVSALMARFLELLPAERKRWFDFDGKTPDLGWVFRDFIGIDVDDGQLALLLGNSVN